MKTKFRRRQRGIVLLVVLSLLTLFTLLLVTFIIVAGQYRQSALSAARVSRVDASPTKLLDNATFALLRDSTDPKNAIRFHSLLFDMYGGDGFVGSVSGVGDVGVFTANSDGTAGNFFDLRINVVPPSPLPPATPTTPGEPLDLAGSYHPLSFVDGYYNGCVLTVVGSSVAQGRTFRVVDYQAAPAAAFPNPTSHVFHLMPIVMSPESSNVRPVAGDRVVLNGRPFNGTGFGYDSTASSTGPKLNPDYTLQPNQLGQTNATQLANFVSGDADESYDAVDFQNMALAGIIPTSTTIAADGVVVIPSFHRPELVNYWVANDATKVAGAIMRPMPWNHPDFDGSNPQLTLPKSATAAQTTAFLSRLAGVNPFDPTKRINPWDVDNDGDRIPDSVWVDLGFPVQTMPDGRQVRPLFAFLCNDLGGRINLNTAGSAGQIAGLLAVNRATTLARNAAALSLPQGQGLSPAEINPTAGSDPLFTSAQHRAMMESRYGANQRPGTNGMDAFASVKHFEFPANYFFGTTGTAYSSPPDVFGELALGLDYRGQPVYDVPDNSRTDLLADSPYEFDVTGLQRGRADNPFTAAELERVLRFNDATARQLPDRLTNLGGIPGNDSRRRSVTTESFDVPAPAVLSLPELRSSFAMTTNWQTQFPSYNSGRPLHVADLLAARLSAGGVAPTAINTEIAKMLSFDLRTGTRMDVNRPFGNAIDDNQNGVVDDHGYLPSFGLEAGADGLDNDADGTIDELDEIDRLWPGLVSNLPFDHDNDPTTAPNQDGYLARHLFARHLFVLMVTLSDGDTDGNGTVNNADREFLAQWVANVVDFRDADSIMTPFEYDSNPFDGWAVDGNIGTDEGGDRAIVWGCERPELLISETLAFHDRRTEDLRSDPSGRNSTDPMGPDNDFDQRLRPIGSFFIELYNPWSGDTKKPGELYYDNVGNFQPGIVLNKRAPSNPGVPYLPTPGGSQLDGAPVWRLLVVGGASHDNDFDPDHLASGFDSNDVERGIYFTDPSSVAPLPNEHRHFSSLPIDPLVPGRFGVVGSGTPDGTGKYVTPIGRRTDAQDDGQTAATTDLKLGTTRRISLTVGTGTSTLVHQVRVFDNVNADPAPPDIQPAIAAVINNGGRLTISEPPGGYPATNWDGTLASGEGAYSTPLDQPLDDQPLGRPQDIVDALSLDPTGPGNADNRNLYTSNLRTVVLQRLANPLLPYNASFNPYRTVDRAAVDITVFEGVYDPDPGFTPPLPSPRTLPNENFGGRARGLADSTQLDGRKLWSSIESTEPADNQQPNADAQVFNYRLEHSLGFLNGTYGARFVATDPVPNRFFGAPKTTIGSGEPFPWLTWNNRPFVSQIELMLVPYARSSQLLDVFGLVNSGSPYLPALKKAPGRRGKGKGKGPPGGFPPGLGRGGAAVESQFGHLLNFFATSSLGTAPPAPGVSAPDLYRIFDYTCVPSRFVGTETWLNPNAFANYPIAAGSTGTELMRGPFNRVPSFREPGKINPNTIFEPRVLDSLLGPNGVGPAYFGTASPSQPGFVDSRRGYGTAGDSMLMLDPQIPTFFANPFRASGAGDLVPVAEMVRPAIETTLLRSTSVKPLDALQVTGPPGVTDALFAMTGGSAHNDPNRNPYFRYQNMQRLANLVTAHSNVYAIWVTMGMFEVTVENNGSGVFVERLGQEAGRETGSVKRHRAFYIVDRSIPVAFQPGENHNVDHAILLRRIIE